MRIVFIGPPGAGKGTQSLRVAAHLDLKHLSTGDVLREVRDSGRPDGPEVAKHLAAGQLVPDSLVVRLVDERLALHDCDQGYLFDGFPRTLRQAEALDKLLDARDTPLDCAVEFAIPHDELFRRLSKRGRADDSDATVRERLRIYNAMTEPLVDYYDRRGVLIRIDAMGSPDDVFARLCAAITAGPASRGSAR
ncbi:MAG: adenylate kinase [Lacipirellulaceae bacterium]